jgi:hypothetical protein
MCERIKKAYGQAFGNALTPRLVCMVVNKNAHLTRVEAGTPSARSINERCNDLVDLVMGFSLESEDDSRYNK